MNVTVFDRIFWYQRLWIYICIRTRHLFETLISFYVSFISILCCQESTLNIKVFLSLIVDIFTNLNFSYPLHYIVCQPWEPTRLGATIHDGSKTSHSNLNIPERSKKLLLYKDRSFCSYSPLLSFPRRSRGPPESPLQCPALIPGLWVQRWKLKQVLK